MVRLDVVEDQREIDAAAQFAQPGRLRFDELEQEEFARLQFRILRFVAEGEHGLLDTLINLCWSYVESSHYVYSLSVMES